MKKILFKLEIITFIVLILLTGCLKQIPTTTIPKAKDAIQNIQEQPQNKVEKDSEYSKLTPAEKEKYNRIKNAIEENKPYEISFMDKLQQQGSIRYDFNNDGKIDILNYSTTSKTEENNFGFVKECNINLNGKIVEQKSDTIQGLSALGIIDVDTKDNYVEFYIADDYLRGGYPTLYRLADKGIEKIGNVDGGIKATSGDGKIYYWGGNLFEDYKYNNGKFNTDLVLSYYDINKNECINTNQIIGKTFISDRMIRIYNNKGDVPNGAPMTEAEIEERTKGKLVKTLEEGEKFQVIEVDGISKIKTEDGKQGWIGGFDMVWD